MTSAEIKQRFPFCRISNEKREILLCFHHAGGSALIFKKWLKYDFPFSIVPVEIPGRGTRCREKCVTCFEKVVTDVADSIMEVFGDKKIYVYGHSIGTIIAFETANVLCSRGVNIEKLFVACRAAPDNPEPSEYRCEMGLEALKQELSRIGATPDDVLEDEYFNQYLLPVIFLDYKLSEDYIYSGHKADYPIVAFNGTCDTDADYQLMKDWGNMTTGEFRQYQFEGGHFFPYEDEKLIKTICLEITSKKEQVTKLSKEVI